MKRIIKYYATNCAMLAAMYFGLVESHTGALNIALFFTWFFGVACLLFFSNDLISREISRRPTNPAPAWIEHFFSAAPVVAWAWHAYWLTAIISILAWIGTAQLWEKRRKANANPPA